MRLGEEDAAWVAMVIFALLLGVLIGCGVMYTIKLESLKSAENCKNAGDVLICAKP